MSFHACVCGHAHADEVESIISLYFIYTLCFSLLTNTWLNFPCTHTVQPWGPLLTLSAVTIATQGIRKWLCSLLHILASKIRLALGCSTARWLPLSTPCGNSRTLFTVHLSVWHHSEKLLDQFPPVCQLSDLMSMATVIQSHKGVFSIWVCLIWHLDKWQDYFKKSLCFVLNPCPSWVLNHSWTDRKIVDYFVQNM